MAFRSDKQRKWFFWQLGKIKKPNYYSASTGWVYVNKISTSSPTRGLPPEDTTDFDAWLASAGLGTIQSQLKTISNLPQPLKWLASPKTTKLLYMILSVLTFLRLIQYTMAATAAANEAFWITKVTTVYKGQLKKIFFNPAFRETVIKKNLVSEISKLRTGDVNRYFAIIAKYKNVLPQAEEIARYARIIVAGAA